MLAHWLHLGAGGVWHCGRGDQPGGGRMVADEFAFAPGPYSGPWLDGQDALLIGELAQLTDDGVPRGGAIGMFDPAVARQLAAAAVVRRRRDCGAGQHSDGGDARGGLSRLVPNVARRLLRVTLRFWSGKPYEIDDLSVSVRTARCDHRPAARPTVSRTRRPSRSSAHCSVACLSIAASHTRRPLPLPPPPPTRRRSQGGLNSRTRRSSINSPTRTPVQLRLGARRTLRSVRVSRASRKRS